MRVAGLAKRYTSFALIAGHAMLLFLGLNLLLRVIFRVGETIGGPPKTQQALQVVYTGMNPREIAELLREARSQPIAYEPFTGFKEAPLSGKYVNVHEAGFRVSKGQGPWPPDPSKLNVFVFGGSTAFGHAVPDHETVASFLGERLSAMHLPKEPRIYNFGRGGYYSTLERLLFEKLLTEGARPELAIFIDGLNDARPRALEPPFSRRLRELFDAYERGPTIFFWGLLRQLPVGRAAADLLDRATAAVGSRATRGAAEGEAESSPAPVSGVIHRYLTNKALIEQAAHRYSVRVAFVWQPVPEYKYDLRHHLFWSEGSRGRGAVYERMRTVARERDLGRNFLWCADMQEDLEEPLYVDPIHYSGRMYEKIAALIARLLVERGLLPTTS